MESTERPEVRDRRIAIVVSRGELERVRAAAESEHRTISAYSRLVLLRHLEPEAE